MRAELETMLALENFSLRTVDFCAQWIEVFLINPVQNPGRVIVC